VKILFSFAILLALLAEGCNFPEKKQVKAATPAAPFDLVGTEWTLADLAGTPVIANSKASIAFPEAGRVAGNGSCNRFTGSVTIVGDKITFGPLASTRMACMEGSVSTQEDAYFAALAAVNRYEAHDSELLIYAAGYAKPLRFTRPAGAPK